MFVPIGNRNKLTSWSACACVHAKLLQSYLTLCNPVDCSPPGFSVQGILQARILEWVAMPFSRGSSPPRGQTCVFCLYCIGRWVLYHSAIWEAPWSGYFCLIFCALLVDKKLDKIRNWEPLKRTFVKAIYQIKITRTQRWGKEDKIDSHIKMHFPQLYLLVYQNI